MPYTLLAVASRSLQSVVVTAVRTRHTAATIKNRNDDVSFSCAFSLRKTLYPVRILSVGPSVNNFTAN